MDKKSSSWSEKASDYLFQGTTYLLYGKKAGETAGEKVSRLGMIIIILAVLTATFAVLGTILSELLNL